MSLMQAGTIALAPLFTLCCVQKSQQQSSDICERLRWQPLWSLTNGEVQREPFWEFSWSMLLFQEKLACESHAMLVLADFPAVFFHISHWYLSWNTFITVRQIIIIANGINSQTPKLQTALARVLDKLERNQKKENHLHTISKMMGTLVHVQ